MDFDQEQLGIISHALRIAAERFNESAWISDDSRIVTQFERQAADVRKIYSQIADRTGIRR